MKSPKTRVIVGLQWGDEGKGKISYLLCRGADAAVRFQGGGNAGHTVLVEGRRLKFNILPAGSAAGARPVIGSGCVIDLSRLLHELKLLRSTNPSVKPVISPSSHIVLNIHRELDAEVEAAREDSIGTTRMGIGPAYSDKCLRLGLRVSDILDPKAAAARLKTLERFHRRSVSEPLSSRAEEIAEYVEDVPAYLSRLVRHGGRVVFEGAQGTLLDIDYGTYPYVTSSNTIAGAACTGSGVPPSFVGEVVGVMKAYTTRVGAGPFPTELGGSDAERIRSAGAEYGTTTGRPRRVGWLDIPALRYACMLNGVSWLAVTKLDILSGMEEVRVCTRYEMDGSELKQMPTESRILERVRPVYEVFRGWKASEEDWRRAAKIGWDELPPTSREYLEAIEEMTGVLVGLVSVGESVGYEVCRTDTSA
ncbi:MAG: adenylosuccinate synthase [Nitrososphaerota archaeon]